MKKDMVNKVMKIMAMISFNVATVTIISTSRFFSYQPKDDYEVYELLKKVGKK